MRITPEGDKLAEKRCAAQSEVADRILSTLTLEEIEQLNALTEKIIHSFASPGSPLPGLAACWGRLLRRGVGPSALRCFQSRHIGALAHSLFFLKNP